MFKCSSGDNTTPKINKVLFLFKLTFCRSEINGHFQRSNVTVTTAKRLSALSAECVQRRTAGGSLH